MVPDFGSDEDLLDRLSARPHELVYLVGSAVTAPPRSGEPGVPQVEGVLELIRGEYRRPSELQRFEAALAAEPDNRYQAAFRFLLKTRGQDVANAVVRRAVLLSRRPSARFPSVPVEYDEGLCRELEDDLEGWHLPPAAEALGRVLAATPPAARPLVLTSNFDPLVTISVRRAGGRAYTTALHGDGSLAGIDGQGCQVVHFHGDWLRTDTLHTPAQLGQDRPKLAASLAHLVSARTLVVLGYSGWDDVFIRSLIGAIRGGQAPIKVAWALHCPDEAAIARDSARLLGALQPGVELGRVVLYKGIDVHDLLPRLASRLADEGTAAGESLAGRTGERVRIVAPTPSRAAPQHTLPAQPVKLSSSTIKSWQKRASDVHSEFRHREKDLDFDRVYQHGVRTVAYRLSGAELTPDFHELREWMRATKGWKGWRPWWIPPDSEGIRPHVRNGLIECCIHRRGNTQPRHADYWLASREGCFFLITGLDEDSSTTQPSTVFSTYLPFCHIGKCIFHAVQMARRFNARSAEFYARYTGLYGRQLQCWFDSFGPRMSLGQSHEHSVELTFSVDLNDSLISAHGLCGVLARELKALFELFDFARVSEDGALSTLSEMLESEPRL